MKNLILKLIAIEFIIIRAVYRPLASLDTKIINWLQKKKDRSVIRQSILDFWYWWADFTQEIFDISEEICIGTVYFIEWTFKNPSQFMAETVLYTKIAWRNLFRNTRRTVVAGLAIGMGLASLILMDAFMKGMFANQIKNATGSFLGEAQIHSEEYKENMEAHQVIHDIDSVTTLLEKSPKIKEFSKRVVVQGMLSSATKSQGLMIWGIDTATEKSLSMMDDRLSKESKYLPKKNSILLGQGLADELGVKFGDRVRLTVSEANTGEPSQRLLKIDGIYSFGSKDMDMGFAAVHDFVLQEMLSIPKGSAHEIAMTLHNSELAYDSTSTIWKEIAGKGNIAEPWPELMTELKSIIQVSNASTIIVGVILFIIVSLSIINTLFMSIYERFFEFGVLKSIGTNARQLFQMVLLEASSLAIISLIFGVIIGYASSYFFYKTGINYNDMSWGGVTFYEKIYPSIELQQYIIYPIFVWVFTVLVSMYPAFFAARMKPAEALRRSI